MTRTETWDGLTVLFFPTDVDHLKGKGLLHAKTDIDGVEGWVTFTASLFFSESFMNQGLPRMLRRDVELNKRKTT